MSDLDQMREALVWNQTDAMKLIMSLQEENRDLRMELDAERHTNKCKTAEISARSAAMQRLRDLLVDLELELQAARYPRRSPAQDRLNEDGEQTFAPNLPEAEDFDEDDKD